ncbi:apolipoprotein D-like protein [Euroglyphus maynei]|uniref:Apolipoprotein D-like protein n=1 Tax=Euroglyphus maynei TaxID=6958 RepID=A0A1Y3BQK9_EURMA|nr:apolipoprotein D-like protein [Euroglyphus maynei]
MFRFIILLATISLIEGQRFVSGPCPSIPSMATFDKTRFLGHWVEVEKTPSIFDFMMRCLRVDYLGSTAGLPITVKGDGLPHPGTKVGKYNIRYGFGVPFQGSEVTIIDTDYKEFAVLYSCTSSIIQGFYHTEYLWLLSRDGTLSNPTRQNIYETLDHLKINRIGLQMSERSTCPNNTLVTRESEQNLAEPELLNVPDKPEEIRFEVTTEDRPVTTVDNNSTEIRWHSMAEQYLLTINPEVKTCLYCIYHGFEIASKNERKKDANAKY